MTDSNLILVTGATGYIGGRLAPRFVAEGQPVRVLARDPMRLEGKPWQAKVEVAVGDVFQPETLRAAMRGVTVAYYMIHSLLGSSDYRSRDITAARNFSEAARQEGVQRIIYLGGLGDPQTDLSQHLRSRQETGDALRAAGVPVTEFRAAVVVGAGSMSFEMIRYLTERLPIMICPRWVFTRIQPIAIHDVLDYLSAAPRVPESIGQTIEIGGRDVVTYGDMMRGYAKERGLRRYLIPVPVLTPRLSSYWVHLVTPIPAAIAQPLIQGLRNEVVVRDDKAHHLFPDIRPMPYAQAVARALASLRLAQVETAWSDALVTTQGDVPPDTLSLHEGIQREQRQRRVRAPASIVYRVFSGLGGQRGWLYANWLWWLRGAFDRLIGGVGMRRGRRHPDEINPGEALDFWRVEKVEPGRLLRLRAEMKTAGQAWLEFEAVHEENGTTRLIQTAYYVPKGFMGWLYWSSLYPFHRLIFSGMIRAIAERAENSAKEAQG